MRLKSGNYSYRRWLGFVTRDEVRQWQIEGLAVIPVKLEIDAYGLEDGLGHPWHELDSGQYIQGCLTGEGVYGVLDSGVPRVV